MDVAVYVGVIVIVTFAVLIDITVLVNATYGPTNLELVLLGIEISLWMLHNNFF